MKIAFFTPGLGIGGIERVFINYGNLLATRGYEVDYLVCQTNGIFKELLSNNVRLRNLNCGQLRYSVASLARYLKENKPQYIMCANSATLFVYIAKMMSFSKVRIIASQHNHLDIDTKSYVDKKIIWYIYNRCYKVIAISGGIQDLLISKGVRKSKIIDIQNPIDLHKVCVQSNEYSVDFPFRNYILYVGRLSKVKNLGLLIESFNKIKKITHDYKLIIAGEGSEENHLKDLVGQLNLESSVLFVGSILNPYPLIRRAKAIVLSSLSEAYPTILVESLALGKTIVSTPSPGALEILRHGELGYISDDFTTESFSKLLVKAIDKPFESSLLYKMSQNYYDPQLAIKKLITILI